MSELRMKGISALSLVLKQEKNRICFEKYIYEKTQKNKSMYNWCIYQIVGLLLEDNKRIKSLYSDVKEGKIGWKSRTFDCITSKIDEFDDYLDKPFEVVEGVVECGKCHSKKTWSVQKQTRSSDEPMTTFSTCVMCGNKWTYSG